MIVDDGRRRSRVAIAALVIACGSLVAAVGLAQSERSASVVDRADETTTTSPLDDDSADASAVTCVVELVVVHDLQPAGGAAAAAAAAADLSRRSGLEIRVVDPGPVGREGEVILLMWEDLETQQQRLPEGAPLNEGVTSEIRNDVSSRPLFPGVSRTIMADPAVPADRLEWGLRRVLGQLLVGRADVVAVVSDDGVDHEVDLDAVDMSDEPPFDVEALEDAGRRCRHVTPTTLAPPTVSAPDPTVPDPTPATWESCDLRISVGVGTANGEVRSAAVEAAAHSLAEQSGYALSVSPGWSTDDPIRVVPLSAEDIEAFYSPSAADPVRTFTSIDHRSGVAESAMVYVDATLADDRFESELVLALEQVLSGHADVMLRFEDDGDDLLFVPDDPWIGTPRGEVPADALEAAAQRCGR